MTDLEEAAQKALKAMEKLCHSAAYEEIQELRQALSGPTISWQSDSEPQTWAVVNDPFKFENIRLTWSDLTKDELVDLFAKHDGRPFSLALAVQDKLREKNT